MAEITNAIAINWTTIPPRPLAGSKPVFWLKAAAGVSTFATAVATWSDVTSIPPNITPAEA
jgi:hypothetical protein